MNVVSTLPDMRAKKVNPVLFPLEQFGHALDEFEGFEHKRFRVVFVPRVLKKPVGVGAQSHAALVCITPINDVLRRTDIDSPGNDVPYDVNTGRNLAHTLGLFYRLNNHL